MSKPIRTALASMTILCSLSVVAYTLPGGIEYKFENTSDNVYVMHGPVDMPNTSNNGFMNNPGIIVGDTGVIVVDPGSSYYSGKEIIKDIKEITTKPMVAIFNTHVHGDHWLGNHAFKEVNPELNIYAHAEMIKQAGTGGEGDRWAELLIKYTEGLTEKTTPIIPNIEIKHLDIIEISGQVFKIHAPTATAHTATDIMIEHVQSKTLFLGDNLFKDRFGRFDDTSDIHNNLDVLEYARKLNMITYVPGHGNSGTAKESLDPFINYLTIIKEESYKGYANDMEDYEIKPNALSRLGNYHDWHSHHMIGSHIGKMLLEIEDRE